VRRAFAIVLTMSVNVIVSDACGPRRYNVTVTETSAERAAPRRQVPSTPNPANRNSATSVESQQRRGGPQTTAKAGDTVGPVATFGWDQPARSGPEQTASAPEQPAGSTGQTDPQTSAAKPGFTESAARDGAGPSGALLWIGLAAAAAVALAAAFGRRRVST
jgi:hypothetical protein